MTMEITDKNHLHFICQQFFYSHLNLLPIKWSDFPTVVSHALTYFEPALSWNQDGRFLQKEIIDVTAKVAADLQHIAKPSSRDHSHAGRLRF